MAANLEELKVSRRTETGKRRMRRMRAAGSVPAVLYGHGEETVVLSVPTEQLNAAIRHGSQLVDLTGELSESALISEIQWDTYGGDVLHVDLTRVSKTEQVDVTVPLELRGAAPGTREGGVVTQPLHEIEIKCPAIAIPDHIEVNINHLELNDVIHASDLALPEGATLLIPADQVVAQCITPTAAPEEEEAAPAEGAEPEIIGRKEEEGEGSDAS